MNHPDKSNERRQDPVHLVLPVAALAVVANNQELVVLSALELGESASDLARQNILLRLHLFLL